MGRRQGSSSAGNQRSLNKRTPAQSKGALQAPDARSGGASKPALHCQFQPDSVLHMGSMRSSRPTHVPHVPSTMA
jgi:hypothetical protein